MRYFEYGFSFSPFSIIFIILGLTVCETMIIFFQVAEGYSPNFKKALLLHFLNLFQSKQLGHDHLVVIMQMLILPMLAHAFQNDQSWEVVDQAIVKTIVDKLLDPPEEVFFLKAKKFPVPLNVISIVSVFKLLLKSI